MHTLYSCGGRYCWWVWVSTFYGHVTITLFCSLKIKGRKGGEILSLSLSLSLALSLSNDLYIFLFHTIDLHNPMNDYMDNLLLCLIFQNMILD